MQRPNRAFPEMICSGRRGRRSRQRPNCRRNERGAQVRSSGRLTFEQERTNMRDRVVGQLNRVFPDAGSRMPRYREDWLELKATTPKERDSDLKRIRANHPPARLGGRYKDRPQEYLADCDKSSRLR